MFLRPTLAAHAGAAVLAVMLLVLPLRQAHAQAGAPAENAVQGAWTHDVNAPQWGETPANVRSLMVKLQGVPRANGPDAFDVVWLRELLRRPTLYHLNDTDQAWMRRTITASEQAHLSHWQPAAAAEAVTAPATPAPAQPQTVPSPAVRTAQVSETSPAPRAVAPVPVRPVTSVRATPVPPPSAPSATPESADTVSAAWAMGIAALVISAFLGLWAHRARQTPTPDV